MRDYTDILHLVVLINLENLNAEMINRHVSQRERLERLNDIARRQISLLRDNSKVKWISSGKN
jgi:hypothetical protein